MEKNKRHKAKIEIFAWHIAHLTCLCLSLSIALLSTPTWAEPYRPLDHLWYGTRDLTNTTSVVVISAGLLATLAAFTLDHSTRDYFAGHQRLGSFEKVGNFWGSGIPSGLLGASTLAFGLFKSRQHEIDFGEAHLEALFSTIVYTEVLARITRRERPDHTAETFPSTHTSIAFTTAAVMMDRYGPAVGVPALALGVLTAASRLSANRHWLSDVVFGAALGYGVGHAYSLHHSSGEDKKVAVLPYFSDLTEFGVVGRVEF